MAVSATWTTSSSEPTVSQLEQSTLDMVLVASKDAVVMVEGSANILPHEIMAEALEWGA